MYKSFEEENKKSVIENQVKMKIDLENLIKEVNQLSKDMKRMQSKDKEIVKQNRSIEKQHRDLFKFLENQQKGMNQQNQTKSGGYSYGD
jgi:adenylosuccinate synthase